MNDLHAELRISTTTGEISVAVNREGSLAATMSVDGQGWTVEVPERLSENLRRCVRELILLRDETNWA